MSVISVRCPLIHGGSQCTRSKEHHGLCTTLTTGDGRCVTRNYKDDQCPLVAGHEGNCVYISANISSTVNSPSHYGGKGNAFEHFKVAQAWRLGPNLYTATKYMCRAGKKDPAKYVEDLEKAKWYLQEEINTQYDLMLKGGKP